MSDQTILALVTALASLIVSIAAATAAYFSNVRSETRIRHLEDKLTEARSERAARREYVYEARKRLYIDFQPVLFQLVERCEGALARIRGIAEEAREERILWPSRLGEGWGNERYHMIATTWDLLTPLAFVRIGQQRLTGLDLSVDRMVRWQYLLSRELYTSWIMGNELAAQKPVLSYDDQEQPTRQHVLSGYLEKIVDCLIRVDESGRLACIRFSEFYDSFSDQGFVETLADITVPLTNFHPRQKPLLWRLLLTQAHLHMAIIKTFEQSAEENDSKPVHPVDVFLPADWDAFD
jgi:hypothetical protein